MKHYLYFWKLGVVAFVVTVFSTIVINLLSTLAFVATGMQHASTFQHIVIAGIPFALIGMPALGYVLSHAIRQAAKIQAPNATEPNTP